VFKNKPAPTNLEIPPHRYAGDTRILIGDDATARASAGSVLLHAALWGLLAARGAHVALHLAAYRAEPWSIVDVRDGGWNGWAGLAGGAAWVAWRAWRHAPWRKALAAGTTTGLLLWSAGTAGLAALAPRDLPDLVLTDLASGQPVRLRELAAGRPVVLNLWATWCGPCRREMPVLAAAQARHPGAVFVFANQGERAETVRRYLDTERLALSHVLLDPASSLGPALGSGGLPTTVFFNGQGRRVDAHMGALNAAALAARLGKVLAP
jgi:thiol-disulfide isomerase/thioredoxin